MADPNELLNPYDKDKPILAGSVFINNTSYSGCDIKVVVNLYDNGTGIQQQINELREQIKRIEAELIAADKEISKQMTTTASSKPGTQEYYISSGIYQAAISRYRRLTDSLSALEEQLKRLIKEAPKASTKVLAECQTLSLSTFRDKQAVRACGSVYPKGFTRGQRELAGSLIFTVFNEHVLYNFLEAHASDFDAVAFTSALMDQLPPVDITIAFANEYGSISRMGIYAVEFVSEGQTMSIEDLLTENVVNYVARDFDPMRGVGQRKIDTTSQMLQRELGKKASDLIYETDYQQFKNAISPYTRFSNRRIPWI